MSSSDTPVPNHSQLFGEISTLVKVNIEGVDYHVPDDLELLRCFQYLKFDIAYEHFCWNASCENCAAQVAPVQGPFERNLCCQKVSQKGLRVEKLPQGVVKK